MTCAICEKQFTEEDSPSNDFCGDTCAGIWNQRRSIPLDSTGAYIGPHGTWGR